MAHVNGATVGNFTAVWHVIEHNDDLTSMKASKYTEIKVLPNLSSLVAPYAIVVMMVPPVTTKFAPWQLSVFNMYIESRDVSNQRQFNCLPNSLFELEG